MLQPLLALHLCTSPWMATYNIESLCWSLGWHLILLIFAFSWAIIYLFKILSYDPLGPNCQETLLGLIRHALTWQIPILDHEMMANCFLSFVNVLAIISLKLTCYWEVGGKRKNWRARGIASGQYSVHEHKERSHGPIRVHTRGDRSAPAVTNCSATLVHLP